MLKDIKITKSVKIAVITGAIILLILGAGGFIAYNSLFGAPQKQAALQQFTVPLSVDRNGGVLIDFTLSGSLKERGFIKSERGFKYALGKFEVQPGAYKISKSMNVWQIVDTLKTPYMKWVVIPEGLRKEQIAEILASELTWNEQQKDDWLTKYTALNYDYVEGVYFPDTYLIPIGESGSGTASRFIDRFNEKFAPYYDKFTQANIKWDTALKIASLVQREAGSKEDMPLIAGIIWNRLLQGMKLDIDATLQYITGQPGNWWGTVKPEYKQIDSKYNTYLYKGLPPHPICNPGLDAIEAVLNPTKTDCFYYLHDGNKEIYCAKTYEEHLKNIEKYLK